VQLSLISGSPKTEGSVDSPQFTSSEGAQVMEGIVVSMMRMSCVQLDELPQASLTTHVRFMVPV
jgi:hypothetical protein